MPAYYSRAEGRYVYQFDRFVTGRRVRARRRLPKAWTQAQAHKYAREEDRRLEAVAAGVVEHSVSDAVACYTLHRLPALTDGKHIGAELRNLQKYIEGKPFAALAEISLKYAREAAEAKLSPATIRNRLAYLRAALRYAHKHHNMGSLDDISRIVVPQVRNAKHVYLDRAQVLRLMRACKCRDTRALIALAYYTGARWISELLVIKPDMIRGDVVHLGTTKNGQPHTLIIVPRARAYLQRAPFALGSRAYYTRFQEARDAIGLGPEITMHTLRHSTASALIQAGATLAQVGAVLNHLSPQATARYAHLTTDSRRATVAMMGRKSPRNVGGKAA